MKKYKFIISLILISYSSYSQIILDNDTLIYQNTNYINLVAINNLPFNAGEVRLVDFIDLLPGYHNYRNNYNNFSVLGSPNEHNLLSIDNSPLLLTSNIILNTSIISDLDLNQTIKSLKYNSVSSVTEVRIKSNVDRLKISGQITPISTQVSGEVPVTGQSNIIFATNYRFGQLIGNRSEKYRGFYNLPFIQDSSLINRNYDFLAKYNHQIGLSNKVSITYYGLNEKMESDLFIISQNRNLLSLNWQNNSNSNRLITSGISCSVLKSKTVYDEYQNSFTTSSNHKNIRYYVDIEQLINNKLKIKYGVNFDYDNIIPNNFVYHINDIDTTIAFENKNSLTTSMYAISNYQLNDWFFVNVGLKYSVYSQFGPGTQYNFENTNINTSEFKRGQIMQLYHGLMPILRFNLNPTRNTDITLAYESNVQYISSIQSVINPYLIPATNNIKPIRMNSIYLTFSQNIMGIQFKIMPFYRKIDELVELKEGASIIVNDSYENELLFGSGNLYGFTSSIHKGYGKFSGWINYSYVHSTKKFDEINLGESYNSEYVKNHEISMVLIYAISAKWNISSIFKYYSGEYVTVPSSTFYYNGSVIPNYSDRNNYKTPDYYRFDLAINRIHSSDKLYHYFSLGLINLFDTYTVDNLKGAKSDYLLGIRPYIKYRFEL